MKRSNNFHLEKFFECIPPLWLTLKEYYTPFMFNLIMLEQLGKKIQKYIKWDSTWNSPRSCRTPLCPTQTAYCQHPDSSDTEATSNRLSSTVRLHWLAHSKNSSRGGRRGGDAVLLLLHLVLDVVAGPGHVLPEQLADRDGHPHRVGLLGLHNVGGWANQILQGQNFSI